MNNPFLLATKKITPLTKRLTPLTNKLTSITEKLNPLKEKLAPVAKRIAPVRRLLYKPLLVVSISLHALLLVSPTPPESNPELTLSSPEKPSPVKREKVKIVSLKGAAKKSPPAAKPKIKQAAKPVVANPRPNAPPPIPEPKEEKPKVEETPKEEKPKEEKPPEEKPKEDTPPEEKPKEDTPPEDKPKEDTPPEDKKETPEKEEKETEANKNSTDPTGSGTGLLKELRDRVRRDLLASKTNTESVVDEYLDALPIDEANNPDSFFDGQSLKAGTIGSLGITQNSIGRTYSEYIEPILKEELGFNNIEEVPDGYGGERLYKARSNEDENNILEFYLSLVKINGTYTFVVIWEKDPRGT